jgi:hypothetical protein
MHMLGLLPAEHVDSADFERYLSSFNDGLFEHQAQLIAELLEKSALSVAEGQLQGEAAC